MRLVTPGTLTEDSLLDARRHNLSGRLRRCARQGGFGLGRYVNRRVSRDAVNATRLGPELARLPLRTDSVREQVSELRELVSDFALYHRLSRAALTARRRKAHLRSVSDVALDAFGNFDALKLRAWAPD